MLTAHAIEGVRLAREHLDTLREARPCQLDDASVAHVVRTWTVTRDDLDDLFIEQGRRWRQQAHGKRQETAVAHYCALIAEERDLVERILALAADLQAVTIEQFPAKSDLEVGLETVLGGPAGWGVPDPDVKQHPPGGSESGPNLQCLTAQGAGQRTQPDTATPLVCVW